ELALLAEVLVVEKVELVEGVPCHLPVVLLVEVTERHRIGQNLVQVLDALRTDLLGQRYRELDYHPVGLDLYGFLVNEGLRPGADVLIILVRSLLLHDSSPLPAARIVAYVQAGPA